MIVGTRDEDMVLLYEDGVFIGAVLLPKQAI